MNSMKLLLEVKITVEFFFAQFTKKSWDYLEQRHKSCKCSLKLELGDLLFLKYKRSSLKLLTILVWSKLIKNKLVVVDQRVDRMQLTLEVRGSNPINIKRKSTKIKGKRGP